MASEAAKQVALEVLRKVRNGEIPNFQEIQQKYGYSESSAQSMKVKETKTYHDIMQPVVEQLENQRQRAITAINNKDLNEEEYKDLVTSVDKFTKNIQLLSGGATERNKVEFGVAKEIYDKNVNE